MAWDFGAIGRQQDAATDRERAKRNHEVNKKVREGERRKVKRRMGDYTERARRSKKAFKERKVVLTPQVVIERYIPPPVAQTLYSIMPSAVEFPTIRKSNAGVPWSNAIYNQAIVTEILGMVMIFVGQKLVASFVTAITGKLGGLYGKMGGLQYTVNAPNTHIRLHTGRTSTSTKAGSDSATPLRPRLENGGLPEMGGNEAYDQPSRWYEFWKWSF